MTYRFLTVLILCLALLSPALAAEKMKPAPAPQDCAKAYDKILKADAANIAALNGRGLCLNTINPGSGDADLNKAVEQATALITADGKNADAYYSRATTYRVLQDYKKAQSDYARAVELKPDNTFWADDLKTLSREAELQARRAAAKEPPKDASKE